MVAKRIRINPSQTLFLDSNIFIYALENKGSFGQTARNIFLKIAKHLPNTFTSTLTIQEVLTKIFENGLEDKLNSYLEFISGNGLITIVDFDKNMAIEAARLRAQFKSLRPPDAIQIAAAIKTNSQLFITADKRIPKKMKSLKIFCITES